MKPQEIEIIEKCIRILRLHQPYPANMIPNRLNFAAARLGYEAAIYQLEKYMAEQTKDIDEKIHQP